MILSDYLVPEKSIIWDYARQCGVKGAVIRLPKGFAYGSAEAWQQLCDSYREFGFTPLVLEPMPDELHTEIKCGTEKRDWALEQVRSMFPHMAKQGVNIICFNFMAHIGWLRTASNVAERGGARVTGFNIEDFRQADDYTITEDELWYNYEYMLNALLPDAEKYGIILALHPDDPPLAKLGNVSRIFTSFENIRKAVELVDSPSLAVTMCQACYVEMGENLPEVIRYFAGKGKIPFIHFRDVVGDARHFHESFHDNGQTDMAEILKLYMSLGLDVPIRVDHVPAMAGENVNNPGYDALGRLYAIGYLKGLLEATEKTL